MSKVLITGAAGFIGSHTVDALLAEGHTVVGLDNFRTGRRENLTAASKSPKFSLHEMDVTDGTAFHDAVAEHRPNAIIHLAALVSVQESIAEPDLNYRLNVHATHVVAEAARRNTIPRVVYASSAAVYGRADSSPIREESAKHPLSPYGWAKLASEGLLFSHAQTFGGAAVCLRYFNVYGERQDPGSPYSGVITLFQKQLAVGAPLRVFGDGEQTRDFIHVADIARANALAATLPGVETAALNVCTGRPVSLNVLARILGEASGRQPQIEHLPPRTGDIIHSCGDNAAARQVLGFEAKTRLEEGLARYSASGA